MVSVGPIVKYAGGKTRLLSELRARLPKTYNRYHEPFVGGGALFFSLGHPGSVIGDTNEALLDVYRAVALDVEAVIKRLEQHKRFHDKDGYYYEVRDLWNARQWGDDPIGAAAAFIYLNKTCFNGLWRVNRAGHFNVPKGDYKNPKIFDPELLRYAAEALSKTQIVTGPYQESTARARSGDFAYLDPPYDPASETSNFTAYSKDPFGREQQAQLAEHARQLRSRGVLVMLSNNDTPYIRSLYEDFCVDNVKCGRAINSKGDKRGDVDEVIVTSYERTS